MAHLVLSRKYRPQGFDELVGQEHVAQTLSNAITSGRIGHAYLFVGPRGTGKTTSARIFAKALNCAAGPTPTPCGTCDSCVGITSGNDLDVVEMDAASNNGVDDVRALRDSVGYRPARSRFRVWIVDEVHMLSLPAFNAFLKTLEEPPPQAKFLFCTTEAHKLPETFTSRVQRLEFRRIDEGRMADRLKALVDREGLQVDDGVCERIASGALGGLRDAESLLEQLLSASQAGRVTLDDLDAVTGRAPAERVAGVMDAVIAGDAAAALDAAGACLDAGGKADTVLEQWIEAWRGLLVRAARARATPSASSASSPSKGSAGDVAPDDVAVRVGLPRISRSIDLLLEKRRFLREGADGRLVVEVAAVELARLPSARDLDALVDALRMEALRPESRGTMAREASPAPDASPSPAPASAAPRAYARPPTAPPTSSPASPRVGGPATPRTTGGPSRSVSPFTRRGGGGGDPTGGDGPSASAPADRPEGGRGSVGGAVAGTAILPAPRVTTGSGAPGLALQRTGSAPASGSSPNLSADDARRHPDVAAVLDALSARVVAVEAVAVVVPAARPAEGSMGVGRPAETSSGPEPVTGREGDGASGLDDPSGGPR